MGELELKVLFLYVMVFGLLLITVIQTGRLNDLEQLVSGL